MNDEKYPDFLNEISNYLLGIANYSKLYVDNIITTIMQFLTFMNTYKFEGKYDSLNKFSINDVRSLSKSDIYSFIYFFFCISIIFCNNSPNIFYYNNFWFKNIYKFYKLKKQFISRIIIYFISIC